MTKKEFIDGINELKQSEWFNRGNEHKDLTMGGLPFPDIDFAQYLARKEAVDVIRDLFIKDFEKTNNADVAPVVHGHWIQELGNVISCRCSRCDHSYNIYEDDINGYPYCAWCGAKMDERKRGR